MHPRRTSMSHWSSPSSKSSVERGRCCDHPASFFSQVPIRRQWPARVVSQWQAPRVQWDTTYGRCGCFHQEGTTSICWKEPEHRNRRCCSPVAEITEDAASCRPTSEFLTDATDYTDAATAVSSAFASKRGYLFFRIPRRARLASTISSTIPILHTVAPLPPRTDPIRFPRSKNRLARHFSRVQCPPYDFSASAIWPAGAWNSCLAARVP